MRQGDIPTHVWDSFVDYFEAFHHDEELELDPETFNQCETVEECFGKFGDPRMQRIWADFCSQSEEVRLWAMSDPRYDD
jgi:hypothetical protein